ncbi:putative P-loop containing nucleoside triphosphate hydrolase, leucine-rich repeat domain, L [Rosa chinensis]|uniref:Putative P-loop containing nucleoside triphosphate hydrolase, leucine-rich repeat domain, L n=1 Tax=Rosa chinensis TaxID=74649 RepID=A0A2P6QUQ2_ROSCH|nr:probable disease resistance protein At5g63020 [Rosa chinensis]PRQ37884.1 putative P-loop containing nucleoside triphosphate hydrolase, leucine-rich repeat domain, L [Rosa chinensis]
MGNIFSVNLTCDTLFSRCWDSIAKQEQLCISLEENRETLQTSLDDLLALRNDVKQRVDDAEKLPQMKQTEQVQRWISKVETVETAANAVLASSIQQVENGGCCSNNYLSSYKYGKRVTKLLRKVTKLQSEGVFKEVAAHKLPAALDSEKPMEPTVGMESLFDEVWGHIEDEDVGVIGLYGMGGVGKTTLLTKIYNNFLHTLNNFHYVIWVVVSKDTTIDIVQNKIGEQIGYSTDAWKHKEQHQKAEDIFRVLSRKQFVLLLDDIWKPVEITRVGVPIPNKQNKSKMVFTTRSETVCCHMDAQKRIRFMCLSREKAWVLFREKVGEEALSIHRDIPELAKAVANECGGLPLALITVGRSMACKKTPQEWSHAVHVLKNSAAEFSGMGDKVLPLLKFSYDNLTSEKIKFCFLYCTLFPEDFPIYKEDLLYGWMGEGLLDGYSSIDQAQNESYDIIGTLVNLCLLEADGACVKMHDVIRDMALWLACDVEKINQRFVLHASLKLSEAIPDTITKWSGKRMSLMCSGIVWLDAAPKCPNLLTLFLGRNNLKSIVRGFFDQMPALRVLDLSGNPNLAELPSGVQYLVSLQHLNLSGTRIRAIPEDLKTLVKLKYLNLEHMLELDYLPQYIIYFPVLRVLRMLNSGSVDRILFCGDKKAMVANLCILERLYVFTLSTESTSCFQTLFNSDSLLTCTQSLHINDGNNQLSSLDITNLGNRKNLHSLCISNYPKLEQLEINWAGAAASTMNSRVRNQTRFLGLQVVSVSKCTDLKDLTWLIFAPRLIHVNVTVCYKMEKVIDLEKLGGVANALDELNPFAELTFLNLKHLPALKSIYENALPFPCLKEVKIASCPALKRLPLNSSSARGCNLVIEGGEEWWNALEWGDELAPNVFLPSFRTRN